MCDYKTYYLFGSSCIGSAKAVLLPNTNAELASRPKAVSIANKQILLHKRFGMHVRFLLVICIFLLKIRDENPKLWGSHDTGITNLFARKDLY